MSSDLRDTDTAELRERLGGLGLRDERRLARQLDRARRTRDAGKRVQALAKVAQQIAGAEQRVAARRAAAPPVTYPPELPVSQARDQLADAIERHQVVVVAGETGSGKTTQLPKICLELGRGVRGMIGHTQPRRLAARTVADRIANELDVERGQQVGFQVRFTDDVGDRTLVKLMTDGILLNEVQRDPMLRAYDTIIIDEAHERSLNIDFLLGYLHQLLPRRPDLKLIITSATIDPERFSRHFDGAPIVEVSGRTYPVEVRYRPPDDTGDGTNDDQVQGICEAVGELQREGPGDILVFLSGEREIRDTADALKEANLRDTEILPLYARLSTAEQQRVFRPHTKRRIVLATNVAETSLTVPGIRYVVDPGTARISRYSNRTKVQRLPIEKVSQASADQRKGRCGRVAEGICVRLYSQEDYEARPAFTDPEILRTNLAWVILQMASLGLGDVDDFPFVDPPDRRSVRDAVGLLHEIGAVAGERPGSDLELTGTGRTLARLPLDPRLGRMLVEADRTGCLTEVLVVTAAMSIQDPRYRPEDERQAADASHARFADEHSDFVAYLNLWEYVRGQQRELSGNAFRRRCKQEFLHYLRIREWQDVHGQLRQAAKELGMRRNREPAQPDTVHMALLSGMLSGVGMRPSEGKEYQGTRGTRFVVWPGSGLARKPPAWVMAAELVETSRLFARTVARIDPVWAERLGGHLVKRTYSEPHWSAKRGAVMAYERVTLYGLPLVEQRRVTYSRIDPEASRDLFIRHALVQGEWRTHHRFLRDNRKLVAELSELEDRARRRDLVVDDDAVHAFYDARVPADVASARHFDRWWKNAKADDPDLLTLREDDLLAGRVREADYPKTWQVDGRELDVTYKFAPDAADDGVTVQVPLAVLGQVRPEPFEWQVPGLRAELVETLIRSLPKDLRRAFVPVPDVVAAVLPRLDPAAGRSLRDQLASELQRHAGVPVDPAAFDVGALPDHLRVRFRVVDRGRHVDDDRDLGALQQRLAQGARRAVALAAGPVERSGQTSWTFGTIPRTVEGSRDGHRVTGYPSLVDEGETVGLRVLLNPGQQAAGMWRGTRRLLLLDLPPPAKGVAGGLSKQAKLTLARNPHGSVTALLADCTACAVDTLMREHGSVAWDADQFARLRAAVNSKLVHTVRGIVADVEQVLAARHRVEGLLEQKGSTLAAASVDDLGGQLRALVRPGFVAATGPARLPDLVRYLQAAEHRLGKAPQNPRRDAALTEEIADVQRAYAALLGRLGTAAHRDDVREIRWTIEELRVSLFAQHLGTRHPVSTKRVLRAIDDAVRSS
jgi:ATP-dependent helicase HrpA